MSAPQTLADALAEMLAENPALPRLVEHQRRGLVAHAELLLRWNRVHNLTRLEEPREVARRHWADSLAGLVAFESAAPELGRVIVDVGSGAGFPGIPAALLWPDRDIVLVEAARKRASFLQRVARELGLQNVRVENGRLEDVAAAADGVISRATLPWERLPALGRLLRPGGWLGAWVGGAPDEAAWRERLHTEPFAGGARVEYRAVGLPERAVLVAQRR